MADSGALDVNPQHITDSAGSFDHVSTLAVSIADGTRDALQSLGPIAGDDEMGRTFMERFSPALEGAFNLLSSVGDAMHKTQVSLVNTATGYNKADEANTEAAQHLE